MGLLIIIMVGKMYKRTVAIILLSASLACCSTTKKDQYEDLSEAQIFKKGKESLDDKKYSVAVKDFETLQSRYPYGEYAERAQLSLIYTYYKRAEYSLAIASINHFLELHPRHENADYAMYMKGLCLYDQNYSTIYKYFPINRSERDTGYAEKSFKAFKSLLETFPNSQYAVDAKQRMMQLKNQLASHELHIAKYYMKKKSFLAAANRAGNIPIEYNGAESVPSALLVMEEAYKSLGMNKLAKEARETLDKNFPGFQDNS